MGPFRGVSTDSRQIGAGEVFVALAGPHHDGHDFANEAVARGARAVVVARDDLELPQDVASIRVPDTLEALGDLAAAYRRRLAVRVVAVTGSNGKTTTKEMIAAVLAACGAKVAKSAGTENNRVGVPLTILRLSGEERFAVVEMGMNRPGEIWRLAEIARPDVGVITNVGPAHLEGLGSLENVAAAKAELALGLPVGAPLVVNGDDPRVRAIADAYPGPTLRTGRDGEVRLRRARPVEGGLAQALEVEIDGERIELRLRCPGRHNVSNALLAAGVGRVLGVDPRTIAAGLEAFLPPPMRLERVVLPSGACLWNDAYNANPASVVAALEVLAAEPARRRLAVLGEMRELGEEAARWHREIGRAAAVAGVDRLVAVGGYAEETVAGAREAGLPPPRTAAFAEVAEAAEALRGELRAGDVVLVKASRAARLERLVAALQAES
jgi:UDP-N-acetylmuramoyl-tripeptide--D-alanyl-D-alanine ligase